MHAALREPSAVVTGEHATAAPLRLPFQVAFLTGQSDPAGAALSPLQERFLAALPIPPATRVPVNFPYPPTTPAHRDTPLLAASWHNLRQAARSRRPSFGVVHRPAVLALLRRAERTLLLAGSCGLDLLANLELPAEALAGVSCFAYGPCAFPRLRRVRLPACAVLAVRAHGDWISWLGSPPALRRTAQRVPGNHLDYLAQPAVLALCAAWIHRETADAAMRTAR